MCHGWEFNRVTCKLRRHHTRMPLAATIWVYCKTLSPWCEWLGNVRQAKPPGKLLLGSLWTVEWVLTYNFYFFFTFSHSQLNYLEILTYNFAGQFFKPLLLLVKWFGFYDHFFQLIGWITIQVVLLINQFLRNNNSIKMINLHEEQSCH